MPFICLANSNIPDGTIQITDLWPNESQRNGAIDPPGQNRYLSRPAADVVVVDQTSGNVVGSRADANKSFLTGLAAYLVDRVDPGAALIPATTVTLTTVIAGDIITIKGVVFEFAAGANDLAGKAGNAGDPFIVGLGANDAAAAANLVLALNDNIDVSPAMDVLAPVNIHTFAAAVGPAVTFKPENGAAALQRGSANQFTVTVSDAATLVLDAASALAGRMVRTIESWTHAMINSAVSGVNGIQTRVDAGLALTLANANTLLLNSCGADLDGSVFPSSDSTGTLAELLSVMAGRVYMLPAGSNKFTAVTAPNTVSVWLDTQRGGFTSPNTIWGTDMLAGEWGATISGRKALKTGGSYQNPTFLTTPAGAAGGDVVNNEIGGVRTTVDSTHLQASLQTGQLSQYAAGISLFPDAAVQSFVSNWTRRTNRQATLTGQRVVTVYDDDGSLLA